MSNFASLRGPVGLNRVYAEVPQGPLELQPWLMAIKSGRTFATNGPLLGFTLDGHEAGDEVKLPTGEHQVKFTAWMRSIVPLDHLEVVCNGRVIRDLKLTDNRDAADVNGVLPVSQSGSCLLRTWADNAEHPILDLYPYATTSPVYISVAGSSFLPRGDADYFLAWIDRLTAAANVQEGWNTEAEKQHVLNMLKSARAIYAHPETIGKPLGR